MRPLYDPNSTKYPDRIFYAGRWCTKEYIALKRAANNAHMKRRYHEQRYSSFSESPDRARPGERLRIGRRLYEVGNSDGSVSYFMDYEADGKQKRIKLTACDRESAREAQRREMEDDFTSPIGEAISELAWGVAEQIGEVAMPLYDAIKALERENVKLRRDLDRKAELQRKRQSTPRAKETRRKRDEAKRQATDLYIKLAKLRILAEEGSTEAERENARKRASELRARLMENAA